MLRSLPKGSPRHMISLLPHLGEAFSICRDCGTITNLECIQLVDQVDRLQEQYHFHGVKLDLIAIGYCEACWRKMEPQTTL